jgi:hypothetical protein
VEEEEENAKIEAQAMKDAAEGEVRGFRQG